MILGSSLIVPYVSSPYLRSHGSLGRQCPPTPAPGVCMFLYGFASGFVGMLGRLFTNRFTSCTSAPSDSQISAISLANAMFTSRYVFSVTLAISAVSAFVGWRFACTICL